MKTLEEIVARIDEIRTELDELETRDEFTDEDTERFDALVSEFDELDETRTALVERAEKVEAVRAAVADPRNTVERIAPTFVGGSDAPYSMDSVRRVSNVTNFEARKVAESAVKRDVDISEADKDHVRSLIEIDSTGKFARHYVAASSDEYRTGWAKFITGNELGMTGDEREAMSAVRAASLTDNVGGYAVPANLDPTIISTKDYDVSPMRMISRSASILNDVWTGISSTGVTAGFAAEASEAGDDAPTLAQPSITPAKADAFVPASIEISQDWASIAQDLGAMFAEAKADLEATAFITGSGSDAPNGIITACLAASTTTVVDSTTASVFGIPDVYLVHEDLPPRHRARASWLADILNINNIRQFGTTNFSSFTVSLAAGEPPQLMGKPLYEASGMDSTVTTNAEILLFGDFNKYLIVDRVGLTVEFIPHLFATGSNRPSGQRGWYAYWRVGADALDTNAFRVLQA